MVMQEVYCMQSDNIQKFRNHPNGRFRNFCIQCIQFTRQYFKAILSYKKWNIFKSQL